MPVLPATGMLRQEDYIVRVNLVYILGCSQDWSSERDYFSKERKRECESKEISRATERK